MILQDVEFGEVIIRRNALAKYVRFSISTSGRLQISVPSSTSDSIVQSFINRHRQHIRTSLPLKNPQEQRTRDCQKKLLTKQARDYLPYRLEYLAHLYGYTFKKCRLSHANTRWGSCSTNQTISLNIGLMKLPKSLRDYVILHELAHLNHMNHSPAFWAEVASHDRNYRQHNQKLKQYQPGV